MCENHGNIIGTSWEHHGKICEHQWQTYGLSWENDEKHTLHCRFSTCLRRVPDPVILGLHLLWEWAIEFDALPIKNGDFLEWSLDHCQIAGTNRKLIQSCLDSWEVFLYQVRKVKPQSPKKPRVKRWCPNDCGTNLWTSCCSSWCQLNMNSPVEDPSSWSQTIGQLQTLAILQILYPHVFSASCRKLWHNRLIYVYIYIYYAAYIYIYMTMRCHNTRHARWTFLISHPRRDYM